MFNYYTPIVKATYIYGSSVSINTTVSTEEGDFGGYDFASWEVLPSGVSLQYTTGTQNSQEVTFKLPSQDVYLISTTNLGNNYQITYNANGGTISGVAGIDYTNEFNRETVIQLPSKITKAGYNFVGYRITSASAQTGEETTSQAITWKLYDASYFTDAVVTKYVKTLTLEQLEALVLSTLTSSQKTEYNALTTDIAKRNYLLTKAEGLSASVKKTYITGLFTEAKDYTLGAQITQGNAGDVTITAIWEAKTLTVEVTTRTTYAETLSNDSSKSGTYKLGDTLTLKYTAKSGFGVWAWDRKDNSGDWYNVDGSYTGRYTYTITANDVDNYSKITFAARADYAVYRKAMTNYSTSVNGTGGQVSGLWFEDQWFDDRSNGSAAYLNNALYAKPNAGYKPQSARL